MATKVNPIAFRLAVSHDWKGIWFVANKKRYSEFLLEDVKIRTFLLKALKDAGVDHIDIERTRQAITIHVHSAKPGFVIGRSGAGIEELIKKLRTTFFRGKKVDLSINVKEVKNPSLSARIVGLQIVEDIERRRPFRRSMKMSIDRVLKARAEGVKITLAGRLNGAEIARTETIAKGKIPLHNLRADIDFAIVEAHTTYGVIGVKVWINRGEVFEKDRETRSQS